MSGLTSSLLFDSKPQAVKSRTYQYHLSPTNVSYADARGQFRFEIPCGRPGTYLDGANSFLRFKLTNNHATATLELDKHASCMIQRSEIYHASNLLELIDNYNVLSSVFLEAQVSDDMKANGMSIVGGSVSDSAGAVLSAAGGSQVFCFPVLSGVIGATNQKYLPLGTMGASDLRWDITLGTENCVKSNSDVVANWRISEVQYIMQIIELGSEPQRMIDAATGGVVKIHTESWRAHQTVQENSTSMVVNLPFRYTSLKTIYGTFRTAANVASNTAGSITTRFAPVNMRHNYRVGSLTVPQQPVDGAEEAWMQVMSAFHGLADTRMSGSISRANWISGGTRYFLAQNFETFSNKTDVLEAGENTLGQTVFFDATLGTAPGSQLVANWFAHFDQEIIIADGIAMVRF
jgi:hypothetical protein